jgi:hypothetical protein
MEGKEMDHYYCFTEELMFMAMSLSLRLMTETDGTMWLSETMSRINHDS